VRFGGLKRRVSELESAERERTDEMIVVYADADGALCAITAKMLPYITTKRSPSPLIPRRLEDLVPLQGHRGG
jgi:hypothetical protein